MGGACALLGWRARSARAAQGYRALVLAGKPVGYWRLGEKEGPVAHDESPHRRDGAFHGRVGYREPGAIAGDANTSVKLNGHDAYAEVPNNAHFSQPASGRGMTVEAWLRPDLLIFDGETREHYVHWLGKGEQGNFEWGMRFYSRHSPRPNRISAYIWNPAGGLGAGAYFEDEVKRGEWIHVAACYDPGNLSDPAAGVSIYKNGRLRGSPQTQRGALYRSFDIAPAHGNAPVRFGTRDSGSFFAGNLDEVAIYPRVLTAQEINEHYRTGSGQ